MRIIDHDKILNELNGKLETSKAGIREILAKGRELHGIDYREVLELLHVDEAGLLEEVFATARHIKNEIYGNRLVLFAPLYVSNLCNNECVYCAFRSSNKKLARKVLTQEEVGEETEVLLSRGHKRVLLVAGESYPDEGLEYVFKCIETIYSVRLPKANIRRINVNVAPLSVDEFKQLHEYKIGTYQLFQETYHEETYGKLHIAGRKRDYNWRLEAVHRAFEGGFDDVGIGILFGLADWRYEILALLQHINKLEKSYGIGPHTISVPRLEPALGSDISRNPPYPVSDADFRKIIAVLRIAVPYTGIILSTRESAKMRREAFGLGISQISAGSRANPGGYMHNEPEESDAGSQFFLGDHRPLQEVIRDIVAHGYIPSFCTGCYRLGRVGGDFMDLARPGLIKNHCLPNGIYSFAEYLEDYADDALKKSGYGLINEITRNGVADDGMKLAIRDNIEKIIGGERDVYF
ncbi:MAG: [FeFe] hydrogenase H-cluster radical SAM maturase HydG [Planctomycetota bacterium]|nr:MAG: [FeFe] hydrogenase H-cluster radical SAM maturase HydG [Planctomycetota bacterium]